MVCHNFNYKNSSLAGRCALVTGASSGIGRETARCLYHQGVDLILIARREDRLQSFANELKIENKRSGESADSSSSPKIFLWSLDISDRAAVEEKFKNNQELIAKVDILINNAGSAQGVDSMGDADLDDWESMINTNIRGLLLLTRLILPYMLKRHRTMNVDKAESIGHDGIVDRMGKIGRFSDIVNLGSVAGRWTYPGGGVYCATKAAVRAITEGLRLDLMGQNIRVTNISPGLVETEFSTVRLRSAELAKEVYRGMTPLNARDVAESIVWSLTRPAHVNIQEMIIFPTDQGGVGYVHRDE